jgi:uncharacterized protein (TIGR00251 family)
LSPPWLRPTADGVVVDLVVQPRASRTRIVGEHGDRLKVQIAAPPVDGEANAELLAYLAATFAVPKREVVLVSGETGKRKTVRLPVPLATALAVLFGGEG